MAKKEHLKILEQGRGAWNRWRKENPGIQPDLSGRDTYQDVNFEGFDFRETIFRDAAFPKVSFREADLYRADLRKAYLPNADFSAARLEEADLRGANLSHAIFRPIFVKSSHRDVSGLVASTSTTMYVANLRKADLSDAWIFNSFFSNAYLEEANLSESRLSQADFGDANMRKANLREADLREATLRGANLEGADLEASSLSGADLSKANLAGARLISADLEQARLVLANLEGADLTGAKVYGISAWDVKTRDSIQKSLIITPHQQPTITVDNLEVAQFIYLLLNNEKIRDVINTIGRKGVLILGRFTPERKAVLNAIREELRRLGYVPILFDFDRPTDKDFTETIMTLAGLSLFIVADITNPKSSPLELQATVPNYMTPFVPIIQEGEKPFSMFNDLQGKFGWVLDALVYDSGANLIRGFEKAVVEPALRKHSELMIKKAQELTVRHIGEYL